MELAYLQHVQEGRLSGIIETEEQELGVLVEQAKGGQNIVDYLRIVYQQLGTQETQRARGKTMENQWIQHGVGGQVCRPPDDRGQVGGWQNRGLPTPVNEPHGGNRLRTSDYGFVNRIAARGRCKMGQMAVVNG